MDQMTKEAINTRKQQWMKSLKREFQNGPIASNVVFALILTFLERLVETEFECPCKEKYYLNVWFVAAFFIIPMILAFVLMASVQGQKCSCDKDNAKRIVHCLVPAFVWMILLVVDGSYIACAMTDWSGRYVTADRAAPLKWCEPENGALYGDRLKKSQELHSFSQWAGLGLVFVLTLIMSYIKVKSPAQGQISIRAPPDEALDSPVVLQVLPDNTPIPTPQITEVE